MRQNFDSKLAFVEKYRLLASVDPAWRDAVAAYLVPMLSIADANLLVLAHEGDGLLNAVAQRRKMIVSALQARLKSVL